MCQTLTEHGIEYCIAMAKRDIPLTEIFSQIFFSNKRWEKSVNLVLKS